MWLKKGRGRLQPVFLAFVENCKMTILVRVCYRGYNWNLNSTIIDSSFVDITCLATKMVYTINYELCILIAMASKGPSLNLTMLSGRRYSSMLAENLVNPPSLCKPSYLCNAETNPSSSARRGGESDNGSHLDIPATDADYDLQSSKESAITLVPVEELLARYKKVERGAELPVPSLLFLLGAGSFLMLHLSFGIVTVKM
ncbi:hypothetical protein SASPL_107055 [Salvia splendens]|uniref:Uncharacterized protein n=1 Tax=Salvia splendens TaxID=180675 RepID=A0A8X8YFS4_SALSN|nr:hypothetical protein SASPL_107055 [Salvia splendens]